MKSFYREKEEYQRDIVAEFKNLGFVERESKFYDKKLAFDKDMFFEFLATSQKDEYEKLKAKFSDDEIIKEINNEILNLSLLNALKNGVMVGDTKINLVYSKPSSNKNESLNFKYKQNKFSIMQEVNADDENKQRVDLVLFLNGFAVAVIELKSNFSGQNYKDAIKQYKNRAINNRLFLPNLGAIIFFAADLNECHMTTELKGGQTKFLPFNKGKGSGANLSSGNESVDDKFSDIWYLWEEILTPDSLVELICEFVFEDKFDNIIFPRYHQLDLIRKIKNDILQSSEYENYLIQHSAGSGKTKSIAWLCDKLARLYKDDEIRFDSILVVTDRKVVDRQLQDEILNMGHKAGFVEALDDEKHSLDLQNAIKNGVKIIISTMQKFLYIKNEIKGENKKFALIIDEAHSSTSGANMEAMQEMLNSEFGGFAKPKNLSVFAFSATPKPQTLQMFGKMDEFGSFKPFHIYSMKQAIEEDFILNVLDNYTTYDTFYQIIKTAKDDPDLDSASAKRQLKKLIELNSTNIEQRVAIVTEHFRNSVKNLLGGKAKAMVVTPSIEAVILYYRAFCEYCDKNGYDDLKALIAFSGSFEMGGATLSEKSINGGLDESRLPDEFNKDEYKFLFVADKYQTGFDQDKLCAMYVFKALGGINAVQTLSRLNRVGKIVGKKTFILDFVNSYDDIESAFAPFFTQTILERGISENDLVNLYEQIKGYNLIVDFEISQVMSALQSNQIGAVSSYFEMLKMRLENLKNTEKVKSFRALLSKFVKLYEFLVLVIEFKENFNDRYVYINGFLKYSLENGDIEQTDITNMVKITQISQNKNEIHEGGEIISDPIVNISFGGLKISKKKLKNLSQIIAELNAKMGLAYEENKSIEAIMKMTQMLLEKPELKQGAKANDEQGFKNMYFDKVMEVAGDLYVEDEKFYGHLLNHTDDLKQIFSVFKSEIYNALRNEN